MGDPVSMGMLAVSALTGAASAINSYKSNQNAQGEMDAEKKKEQDEMNQANNKTEMIQNKISGQNASTQAAILRSQGGPQNGGFGDTLLTGTLGITPQKNTGRTLLGQ